MSAALPAIGRGCSILWVEWQHPEDRAAYAHACMTAPAHTLHFLDLCIAQVQLLFLWVCTNRVALLRSQPEACLLQTLPGTEWGDAKGWQRFRGARSAPLRNIVKGPDPMEICLLDLWSKSSLTQKNFSFPQNEPSVFRLFFFLFKDTTLPNSSELGIIWICHMVLIYRRFCLAVNTDKRNWGFPSRMNILYLMKARF